MRQTRTASIDKIDFIKAIAPLLQDGDDIDGLVISARVNCVDVEYTVPVKPEPAGPISDPDIPPVGASIAVKAEAREGAAKQSGGSSKPATGKQQPVKPAAATSDAGKSDVSSKPLVSTKSGGAAKPAESGNK